jgi:hypothetical protein
LASSDLARPGKRKIAGMMLSSRVTGIITEQLLFTLKKKGVFKIHGDKTVYPIRKQKQRQPFTFRHKQRINQKFTDRLKEQDVFENFKSQINIYSQQNRKKVP